jgi:hypothetical protein
MRRKWVFGDGDQYVDGGRWTVDGGRWWVSVVVFLRETEEEEGEGERERIIISEGSPLVYHYTTYCAGVPLVLRTLSSTVCKDSGPGPAS